MTGKRRPRGQSFIELIMALGIFSIVIGGIFSLFMSSRSLVTDSSAAYAATKYAREGIDAVSLMRDQNWDLVTEGTHGVTLSGTNWVFVGASDSQNGYTRAITVTNTAAHSKTVRSNVTWASSPIRPQSVVLETVLTNWEVTQAQNYVSGDWRQPVTAGTASINPSGNSGTDVVVQDQYAYLASSQAASSKPDFTVFDVSNPSSPVLACATESDCSIDLNITNLRQLAKLGTYVYGANEETTNQFVVVDVTDPAKPVSQPAITLATSVAARSIGASGSIVAVGTVAASSGPEVYIYSVSNPASPQLLGTVEVGHTVHGIHFLGNRMYIVSSSTNAELSIYNMTTPASPLLLGSFNASGDEDGISLFVKNEANVYLGRSGGGNAEFYVLDTTNPVAIVSKGSFDLGTGIALNELVVVNHLAFLGTDDTNNEFKVVDVSNPAAMVRYESAGYNLNFPQNVSGLAYENNTIYVSVRSNAALRIIRSSGS